jgi:MFS transporter, ACS family, glucarate transporter
MKSNKKTRVRWLLVSWLFLLSAAAYLDRVNLSVAGTYLAAEYNLSNVQFGLLSSVFLLGYALCQTPAGWLADRWGSRRVLFAGVVWWGIFTALTAAIPTTFKASFLCLASVRFLLGAGEAVMYPCSNQFVSKWIPTQERGFANGLIFAGVGAGSALSPPLVIYVMLHFGWRLSFWICAAIGLLAGATWFVIARDTPDQQPLVSETELAYIRSGLTLHQGIASSDQRKRAPWRAILRDKNVWAVTVSYFCFVYVAWIFFAWFYRYLAEVRGMDLKTSAVYGTLPFIAMTLGCSLGGIVGDFLTQRVNRRVGRCGLAMFGMTLSGMFLAWGGRVDRAAMASVVLAGGAGALYLSQSSFWALSADIGGKFSGSVSGLMNMGGQLGGAVTASLTPLVGSRFGWGTSFMLAAILAFLGAAAWLVVDLNIGAQEEAL